MNLKKYMIILILTIFLFSIAGVSAGDVGETIIASEDTTVIEIAQTDDVGKKDDINQVIKKSNNEEIISNGNAGTFSELQNNISANYGSTLKLDKDYKCEDGFSADGISITDFITIDGQGYTIDAQKKARVFNIQASNVTIKNLNIINADYNGNGGAIYFNQSGSVINCNFTGNNAGRSGGAVLFTQQGTVSNCNFINNTAIVDGGAVFFNETGIVSYCNFNNNFASLNGGAIYFNISGSTHIVTNCNFTDNKASDIYSYGGAILMHSGTVKNCNFNNNIVLDRESCGGAVFFWNWGNVSNCNFTGNTANQYGGAVYFLDTGNVLNCNFMGNTAANGGAVFFKNRGDVLNCNFINNTAYSWGGAVYFDEEGTVTNCNFANNHANKGGSILSLKWWTVTADTCIFKTDSDSPYNTHNLPPTLNVDNFTTVYGSGKKLTFDLRTNISNLPVTNGNISISIYNKDNGAWVGDYDCLSSEGWAVNLSVGSYIAVFNTEYAEFKPINRTITITLPDTQFYANMTPVTTNNKTVNITAKSNIPKNLFMDGKLLFVLPNNINITANYAGNGTWWANYTFNEYSEYEISALYIGLDNVTVNNATLTIIKANSTLTINDIVFDYGGTGSITVNYTNALGINASVIGQHQAVVDVVNNTIIVSGLNAGTYILSVTTVVGEDYNPVTQTANITVNKAKTVLTANAVTTVYNVNKYLTITLKDVYGNPLKDVEVGVNFNGVKYLTTDKNGQIKIPTKVVSPNKYNVKITFDGNANYLKSSTSSKVVIKKASSKITAAKKTFKAKTKVKKYAVVLKDITNSPIINAKLTLKVKGKTYSAKTNYKGKAVFKITKLNKKGTYKAVIKFNGNKYYLKSTKNTKITVKASKTTFKTVSQGSKDTKTVKKIQQALKDHGYYLSYKGHYLKVDGKYESCTSRSVKEFQHDKGLKVTGKVDEKTAHKLGII